MFSVGLFCFVSFSSILFYLHFFFVFFCFVSFVSFPFLSFLFLLFLFVFFPFVSFRFVSFVLPYIKSSQSHLSSSMQFKHLSKPEGIVRAIIICQNDPFDQPAAPSQRKKKIFNLTSSRQRSHAISIGKKMISSEFGVDKHG